MNKPSEAAPVDAPARKVGPVPASRVGSRRRRLRTALIFMAPALMILGALVVYPVIYTIIRSFYNAPGDSFVGWDNYVAMFTNASTFTAIRNNIIWVIVAPATVTFIGLIFAVLLDRIRWSAAFKIVIFMPMAISMLAAGVIFRGMFQEDPNLGVVNATVVGVESAFTHGAEYPGATPRTNVGLASNQGIISTDAAVSPGSTQDFPLVSVRTDSIPATAEAAQKASPPGPDQITGTAWLDFVKGGGGVNGAIDPSEKGLPGIKVDAVAADGTIAGSATTDNAGRYVINSLPPGSYHIALPASNFSAGPQGVPWLSSTFITAVVILAYVWIWAGFAMVMIASGLSAMDRTLQEAARMDGANEWQVFTRITAPLLKPVLVVVFVTLIINVLKIFDLVYVIPPGSAKPAANVIAVEMWTVSFGGGNNQGLGSALAILLLVLVLPFMIINVRRFKQERS